MLYWLDLETTGLDPKECAILEIGIMVTTDDLTRVAQFQALVHPLLDSVRYPGYARSPKLEDGAMELHKRTGIYEMSFDAQSLEQVSQWARSFVLNQETDADGRRLLAGSTVHFDRAFLDVHMPQLSKLFHYRHLDVSAIKEAARIFRPEVYASRPKARAEHRAIPDIEDSIAELRHYMDVPA